MKNKNLTKGSVWRKWDLQIHVPGAKHSDEYESKDGLDIWDKFLDYLKNSDIDVFGVTDYFSIDGYEQLIKRIKGNSEFKDKIFFPNIELRLDINTNRDSEEINIHLIFDNNCETNTIKKFLSNLETTSTKDDGTSYSCSPNDLQKLGYDKASVSLNTIKEALKKKLKNKEIFIFINSTIGFLQ